MLFGHLSRGHRAIPEASRIGTPLSAGPGTHTVSEDDAMMALLPRTEQDCAAACFRVAEHIAKKDRQKVPNHATFIT